MHALFPGIAGVRRIVARSGATATCRLAARIVVALLAMLLAGSAAARLAPTARAQAPATPDLFDQTVVRDLYVQFADPDWQQQLELAGEGTNVRADLTVDGQTYGGVGLRYKGLSSVRAPGPKKPFNLSLDAFRPGQRLYGIDTVNLNNSYADPSYLREVLTNDLLRPFMPTPRGAYARLYLNGSYWGLYILSEQIEGSYVDDWFPGRDGLLVKADSPSFGEQRPRAAGVDPQQAFGHQSNLTWQGEGLAPYRQNYELKTAAAGDSGYEALRELTRALDGPVSAGGIRDSRVEAELPKSLDVDAALWYLAGTNALMNYDSYYFGHNYFLHRPQRDPRWVPLLWDTSLGFGVFNIAGGGYDGLVKTTPFLQETDATRPLVRRLLAVPRWRADYIAHFQAIRAAALDAAALEAHARALRDLIRPALAEDKNQLYTLEQFEKNLYEDVSLGPGAVIVSNGEIPGILPLVRARAAWIDKQASLLLPQHALASQELLPPVPAPDEAPLLRAAFSGPLQPTAVEAVLRVAGGPPTAHAMSREGDAWSVRLPGLPARTKVTYYLHLDFAKGQTAFHPAANWQQPFRYRVAGPQLPERPGGPLALNELMADNVSTLADEAGAFDDWVELVNRGPLPVSLEGIFLGPSADDPWAFALPTQTLEPGQHLLVWCDDDASEGPLHAPFKLSKAGDGLVLASREALLDAVTFGPQGPDRSWARLPEAQGDWLDCASPSPLAANTCSNAPTPTSPPPPTPSPTSPAPTATPPSPAPTATDRAQRWTLFLPWGER